MIVVTDGESHDGEELPEALAECDKRNVTRYAIAVSRRPASVSPLPLGAAPGSGSGPGLMLDLPCPGAGALPAAAAGPRGFHPGDQVHCQRPRREVLLQRQRRGRAQRHRGRSGRPDLQPGRCGGAGSAPAPTPAGLPRNSWSHSWRHPVSFRRHPGHQRELLPAGDVPDRLLHPPAGGAALGVGGLGGHSSRRLPQEGGKSPSVHPGGARGQGMLRGCWGR